VFLTLAKSEIYFWKVLFSYRLC